MPSFCRHGRFETSCPICSMKAKKAAADAPTRVRRGPRGPSEPTKRSRPRRTSSTMSVRRLDRAEDDGYDNGLVPGLRSSADARRLAEEIAFAVARLEALQSAPTGIHADVVAQDDPREAAWLAFLIAVLSPLEGTDDPWAGIAAARTTFASGELPDVSSPPRGPRAGPDPAASLKAFRVWMERPDAMLADTSLPADRRFDRLYERLGLASLARTQRYEFLLLSSRLGVGELDPRSLHLGEPRDDTTSAAKRVFAIGDTQLLARRAAELAMDVGIPLGALDLALVNWGRPAGEPRITGGVHVDGVDIATIAYVLGVHEDADGEWTLPADSEFEAEDEAEAPTEALAPVSQVEADVETENAVIEHEHEREAVVAEAMAVDSDDPTQGRDD